MPGALTPYKPLGSTASSSVGEDLTNLLSSVGVSGTSIGSGSVPATTTTQDRSSNTSTANTGTKQTNTTGASQTQARTQFDKRNMDEQSLQLLRDTLANLAGGGEGTLAALLDATKKKALADTQGRISASGTDEAVARAGGRTADLARGLNEGAIATLLGSNEAGGFGGNALSQLLAQDAAVRTGEAQARVEEEAFNAAIQQQNQSTSVLDNLIAGGSAVENQIMELLGLAKGAVEQGSQTQDSSTVSSEQANTVTSDQGTESTTSSLNQAIVDPLGWAKLQASLGGSGTSGLTQGSGGPSDIEKALALFPALGGDSQALLASMSQLGGLNSTKSLGGINAAGQSFQSLIDLLGRG